MRYGADDKFWLVTDARPESTEADVLSQASLRSLANQFAGGLTMDEHPTLFTDEREAEIEAFGRLTAMRAAQAIARSGSRLQEATRIEILGGDGKVLFESDLPTIKE